MKATIVRYIISGDSTIKYAVKLNRILIPLSHLFNPFYLLDPSIIERPDIDVTYEENDTNFTFSTIVSGRSVPSVLFKNYLDIGIEQSSDYVYLRIDNVVLRTFDGAAETYIFNPYSNYVIHSPSKYGVWCIEKDGVKVPISRAYRNQKGLFLDFSNDKLDISDCSFHILDDDTLIFQVIPEDKSFTSDLISEQISPLNIRESAFSIPEEVINAEQFKACDFESVFVNYPKVTFEYPDKPDETFLITASGLITAPVELPKEDPLLDLSKDPSLAGILLEGARSPFTFKDVSVKSDVSETVSAAIAAAEDASLLSVKSSDSGDSFFEYRDGLSAVRESKVVERIVRISTNDNVYEKRIARPLRDFEVLDSIFKEFFEGSTDPDFPLLEVE